MKDEHISSGYSKYYDKKGKMKISIPTPQPTESEIKQAICIMRSYKKLADEDDNIFNEPVKKKPAKTGEPDLSYLTKPIEKEHYWDRNYAKKDKSSKQELRKHWEDKRDYICPCGESVISYVRSYKYVQSRTSKTRLVRCECDMHSYKLYSPL